MGDAPNDPEVEEQAAEQPAPEPAPDAKPILEISAADVKTIVDMAALVERWWHDWFHDSPVSRCTAAWNHPYLAKKDLQRRLTAQAKTPEAKG